MDWLIILFLITGFIGGIITALAGGTQFLIFPMLNIIGGLPVRTANGTSSMSVWPSPLVTGLMLGKNTSVKRKTLWNLIGISLVGSCIGVLIVSKLTDNQFREAVPFLLLIAAIALTWGQRIRSRLKKPMLHVNSGWLYMLQFVLALYAGVYGGGVAIMMLAAYGFFKFSSPNASQQLKNLLTGIMNCAAATTFALTGLVAWNFAVPLMIGNIAGGIVGARLLQSLNPALIRRIVILFAWAITTYYITKLFV